MRLLCYIMETDYMETLTPICVSLTNLAEHQLRGQDVDVSMAGKSRQGGQSSCASWLDWAGGLAPCLGMPTSLHIPPTLIPPSPGNIQVQINTINAYLDINAYLIISRTC